MAEWLPRPAVDMGARTSLRAAFGFAILLAGYSASMTIISAGQDPDVPALSMSLVAWRAGLSALIGLAVACLPDRFGLRYLACFGLVTAYALVGLVSESTVREATLALIGYPVLPIEAKLGASVVLGIVGMLVVYASDRKRSNTAEPAA